MKYCMVIQVDPKKDFAGLGGTNVNHIICF